MAPGPPPSTGSWERATTGAGPSGLPRTKGSSGRQAIIVDEVSMVVDAPMAALLRAMKNEECRLVLVGDPDQLPSVGDRAGSLTT